MKKTLSLMLLICLLFSCAFAENVTQWDYELIIDTYTITENKKN